MTLEKIAACLFVLCFPLLLLGFNLRAEVSFLRLYEYGFDRYHAEEATGLERPELKKAARGLIGYFNGSRESPQVQVTADGDQFDLFNQKELDHLRDVKGLIRLFYTIQWITLVYMLGYIVVGFVRWKRSFLPRLMQLVFFGGVFTLGALAFLGIWAAIDFDGLFLTFHQTSFSNDLWQLDPSEDYLIMMFPEAFFRDAAILLIVAIVVEASLLGGGAWYYLRKWRRASQNLIL